MAMNMDVGVRIAARVAGTQQVDNLRTSMTGLERGIATMRNSMNSLRNIAALGGVTAALSSAAYAIGGLVKSAADLGDVAENIGLTAEQVQAYNHMAVLSGRSSEAMSKGLQEVAEQSKDTNSALAALFAANGIAISGMGTDQSLRTFADLLQNARDPAEQLQIAVSVLGTKVGRELVAAFKEGAAGVDAATRDMVESGRYLTEQAVNDYVELEKRYGAITGQLTTWFQQGVVGVTWFARDMAATVMGYLNQVSGATAQVQAQVAAAGKVPLPGGTTALPTKVDSKGNFGASQAVWDSTLGIDRKAIDDAAARKKMLDEATKALVFQGQQLQRTDREQAIYNELNRLGLSLDSARGKQIAALAGANYDAEQSIRSANDATRDSIALKKEETRLNLEARQRVASGDLDRIEEMASRTTGRGVSNALSSIMDDATNYAQQTEELISNIYGGMEDALANFIKTGKLSFKELANSIIDSMANIASKNIMSGLIGSLFGGSGHPVYGGGGGGGFLSSLLGGFLPSYDVGTDYVPHDQVAMVHKGEKIIPAAQAAAYSGGVANVQQPPVINIMPPAGTTVEASTNRSSDGSYDVQLILKKQMENTILSGALNPAMKAAYGLMPTMTRRTG